MAAARSVKEQRKKLLSQKGGFVTGVLIGALLSSIVGKLLDKYAH